MIKKQQPLTLTETKKILDKINDSESPRIKKTKEYLKKVLKKKTAKTDELLKKLNEAGITKLKQEYIVKIADIMPETSTDLRNIFAGEELTLEPNEIEKILQVVKELK